MQSEEETWSQEFLLAFPAGEQTTVNVKLK